MSGYTLVGFSDPGIERETAVLYVEGPDGTVAQYVPLEAEAKP